MDEIRSLSLPAKQEHPAIRRVISRAEWTIYTEQIYEEFITTHSTELAKDEYLKARIRAKFEELSGGFLEGEEEE